MTTLRTAYESQLRQLMHLAEEPAIPVAELSNRELLLAINKRLKRFNCRTWTKFQLIAEGLKLDRENVKQ